MEQTCQNLPWTTLPSFDEIENQGILAGTEENGNKVYVGRTFDKDGNFVIAKVVPALLSSFYAFNGAEESSDQIEILENSSNLCHWVKSDGKQIEDAAVLNGFYIGRALYNGNVVVGCVDIIKNELLGSYQGSALKLPSYDVLICKSKGVVYETIQKASNYTRSATKINNNGFYEDLQTEQKNEINLANKIRNLELERSSYLRDKQSFEQRLDFEQRKVKDFGNLLKKMKIDNARLNIEHSKFEEKFNFEQQKASQTSLKLQEYALNNSHLIKKVGSLEEAIRCEKMLVASITEKFSSSQKYNKNADFEETIRAQQEKIFELESEIMMSASSTESMLKQISDYEGSIDHLRIQIEVIEKKLEISCNDNHYLIDRLSMLTKMLRTHQNEIENLTIKLQSSKTVIASTHAELSRANGQVSKYQAALSSCYALNGDLMTKVSGLNSLVQSQTGNDSRYHLINYTSELSYGSKISSILEVSTLDEYEEIQAYGKGQPEKFTPFKPTEESTPYAPQFESLVNGAQTTTF